MKPKDVRDVWICERVEDKIAEIGKGKVAIFKTIENWIPLKLYKSMLFNY